MTLGLTWASLRIAGRHARIDLHARRSYAAAAAAGAPAVGVAAVKGGAAALALATMAGGVEAFTSGWVAFFVGGLAALTFGWTAFGYTGQNGHERHLQRAQ